MLEYKLVLGNLATYTRIDGHTCEKVVGSTHPRVPHVRAPVAHYNRFLYTYVHRFIKQGKYPIDYVHLFKEDDIVLGITLAQGTLPTITRKVLLGELHLRDGKACDDHVEAFWECIDRLKNLDNAAMAPELHREVLASYLVSHAAPSKHCAPELYLCR